MHAFHWTRYQHFSEHMGSEKMDKDTRLQKVKTWIIYSAIDQLFLFAFTVGQISTAGEGGARDIVTNA